MNISVRWLNELLDPADVTAEGAERVLTHAGFPVEEAHELPDGDVMLDVEVTSNRGDCLSHIGIAREIAAVTGRRLRVPRSGQGAAAQAEGAAEGGARALCALENRVPELCPLFTARVIKGVKVGPSPEWMVRALGSVGQRSINNVVDVTNYVMFEYGQPSHVFDLATLRGGGDGPARVVVRLGERGERLAMLDGRAVELGGDEVVVADAERAVSLAGIMGGAETEVTEQTVDVLLEAATWDPLRVRTVARRFQIRTDASHRFERIVDPRTIETAARRAAALIVELAGGELIPGVLAEGAPLPEETVVRLRPQRCRDILGTGIGAAEMVRLLRALEIDAREERGEAGSDSGEGVLVCRVPPSRPDLTREIDLIEEVARTHGLDRVPLHEKIVVRVAAPQASERAVQEAAGVLCGMGFYEAVTFSFVSRRDAAPFLGSGARTVEVCDERRKAEPVLRPSVLPGLLACRKANQDAGVSEPGGVRLFEIASAFDQRGEGGPGSERERRRLALLVDVVGAGEGAGSHERAQASLRLLRGAVEAVARALGGSGVDLRIEPCDPSVPAYEEGACGAVMLGEHEIGRIGLISRAVQGQFDLTGRVAACEVSIDPLVALYPPSSRAGALPKFPGIERDLSLVVDESVSWSRIASVVEAVSPEKLESVEFVGVYRGEQAGKGKKSVTLRMRFRDPERTLRHEEVDPQVSSVVERAAADLNASLRA